MDSIKTNFYETAYLLSQDFIAPQIEFDENGRVQFHFNDFDLIKLELEEFKNNEPLKRYVESVIKLRKKIRAERKKYRKANKVTATPKADTDTATTN